MPDAIDQEIIEQMQSYLDLQIDVVAEHLEIINPKNTDNSKYWPGGVNPGPLPMYRIDKNMPETLYPNMPKSAMATENSTMPRITCAPSLIGCIVGYYRAEQDLLDSGRFGKDTNKLFRGGYHISTFEPQLILKPGAELVPDQGRSDEHWVVSFNEDHVSFKPTMIGKCFISKLTHVNTGGQGKPPKLEMEIWIEMHADKFPICPGKLITKGYWKMHLAWESLFARDVRKAEQALLSLVAVSEEEYVAAKGLSANMLSNEVPAFMKW